MKVFDVIHHVKNDAVNFRWFPVLSVNSIGYGDEKHPPPIYYAVSTKLLKSKVAKNFTVPEYVNGCSLILEVKYHLVFWEESNQKSCTKLIFYFPCCYIFALETSDIWGKILI